MAEISPAEVHKSAKAPEKLKKKASSKEVKGFYYHAAEYQRARQQERKGFVRVLSSIAEPFTIHLRAARLAIEAKRKGGVGGSTVLDNDTTKKLLEGKLTDQEKAQFRVKSQSHKVFETYQLGSAQDQQAARSILSTVFNKKGNISPDERALFEKQIDAGDLDKLLQTARENASAYSTIDEMKGKFTDDVMFGALTETQQKQAKKLAHMAIISTGLTIANIAKYPVIVGAMGLNPFLAAAGGGALSGIGRASRLSVEGLTFDISRSKGIEIDGKTHNLLGKIFSVDWESDPSTRRVQLLRAAFVGGALSFAARWFAPTISEAWNHPGDTLHNVGDTFGQDVHKLAPVPVPVHNTVIQPATGELNVSPGNVHEHLNALHSNTTVRFLPDTAHHDWQQLHTFAQHMKGPDGKDILDAKGHPINEIRLSYNGVDDGIPHNKHFIDLMLNNKAGGEHVFIQNDAVLAVNGPDADKLVAVYKLVNGHMEPAGYMQSANLATQMGLSQGSIDHFAQLTHIAGDAHHAGLWHGTQNASDLQTIMFRRGLYDDGAGGKGFWAMRLGGGYVKNGHFYVGASNHYWDHGLANNTVISHYNPLPSFVDEDTPFRSSIAEGLRNLDEAQDDALARMFGLIHREDWAQQVDNFTDYGLYRLDDAVLAINELFQNRIWEPALGIIALHAGVGAGAAYLGRKRAENPGRNIPTTTGLAGLEGIALAIMPSLGATTALAYWIAKAQRMGRLRSTVSVEKKPAAQPATPPIQSPSQPTAPTQPSPVVQSEAAVNPETAAAAAGGAGLAGAAASQQNQNTNDSTQSAVAGAASVVPPPPAPPAPAVTQQTAQQTSAETLNADTATSASNAGTTPPPATPEAAGETVPAETIVSTEPVSDQPKQVPVTTVEATAAAQTPEKVESEVQAESNQQTDSFPSAPPINDEENAASTQTPPAQMQEAESVPEDQQTIASTETPAEAELQQAAPIAGVQPTVPPTVEDEQKEEDKTGLPTNPPQQ